MPLTKQNMGEGPDDDPSATKAEMREEQKAFVKVLMLEKCVAENAKLRLESSEKDKKIVEFRRQMKEKDVKIQELWNEFQRLNDEFNRLLGREKSFTLRRLVINRKLKDSGSQPAVLEGVPEGSPAKPWGVGNQMDPYRSLTPAELNETIKN